MYRFLYLLVLSLIFASVASANASTDSILARYRRYYLSTVSIAQVDRVIEPFAFNTNANGQWNDINYADSSPAYWQTRNHLGRVEALAVAWAVQGGRFHRNKQLWQTISDALDHWVLKKYTNSNWWVNEIGVPQGMRNILVLIADSLSPQQLGGALEVLAQHKVRGVGANLIWSADLAIHYGALIRDEAMIEKSVRLVANEIKVSTGEGIQPDYSYHQHEARLQIYHYGNSYLETNVRLAWEVHGTPWAVPAQKVAILSDFVINGWQWMSRGINTVPGTIDRAASRKDQLHNPDLRRLIPYLCELDPVNAFNFRAIGARQDGRGKALSGFRYFPYSDFTAYHRPGFSFFLKTISTRTLKSESINTENLLGRLLNNGDGYLISNGDEYFNLMPAWNWNLLPGQTNTNSSADTIMSNAFCGSVGDGGEGFTAMKYAVSGGGNEFSCYKMWVAKGNAIVCLISGLTGEMKGPVFTALNQSRWRGPVATDGAERTINSPGTHPLSGQWLHHGKFGYILLGNGTLQVRLDTITAAWNRINASAVPEPATENVFTPLLRHDSLHRSATAYALVFAPTAAQVRKIAAAPTWKVARNDTSCQAVVFSDGVVMAAFSRPGHLVLQKKEVLTVDRACLVKTSGGQIFVSDPLHIGGALQVVLHGKKYLIDLKSDGTTTAVPQ